MVWRSISPGRAAPPLILKLLSCGRLGRLDLQWSRQAGRNRHVATNTGGAEVSVDEKRQESQRIDLRFLCGSTGESGR
jgi:hypothetical protein